MSSDPRKESVAIIGSGAAGIITAHTLLRDGFSRVQILTRDGTPGGVWAKNRVYPGLQINNVHGEYRFSAMRMPPPADGGRLMGDDLSAYMQAFSDKYIKDVIRFNTEVVNIRRDEASSVWFIIVQDMQTGSREVLEFARVVLCTGGCSTAHIPLALADQRGFKGLVIHSVDFSSQMGKILEIVPPVTSKDKESGAPTKSIVVVGGGRSAQDAAAYFANAGRKVSIIFDTADAIVASPMPLPAFIRKSRLLAIMSVHIDLPSRLERFLHNTWLGSKITRGFWSLLSGVSLNALAIPKNSPLRNTRPLFWSISTNDEGIPLPNRFHALVNSGKISVIAPAHVDGFGLDGHSLLLADGRSVDADVVVLATGHRSSWTKIFDEKTAELIGIGRQTRDPYSGPDELNYSSLANPPAEVAHYDATRPATYFYNGVVPAKNFTRRDFAVNGAVFTTNVGYTWEVVAHWVSSYFLGDHMNIPRTVEEAYKHTEREIAFVRKRYPEVWPRINESNTGAILFFTWPQYTDRLLREMGLPTMRSGGNWLTWPIQVI
ncbi:FAD/NAD-P-binding domain-containing protein [Mycena rebaudengoi]|nr:FAD/NAD-P-binding domain-containing protein [Mycena rebaudengoi]